jgi:hypothetical protein
MARSLPVNVSLAIGRGSTDDESYAHSRLRKDCLEIHARVLAGEITAHAEMTATASALNDEAKYNRRTASQTRTIGATLKAQNCEIN